jgi:hypothetical protein
MLISCCSDMWDTNSVVQDSWIGFGITFLEYDSPPLLDLFQKQDFIVNTPPPEDQLLGSHWVWHNNLFLVTLNLYASPPPHIASVTAKTSDNSTYTSSMRVWVQKRAKNSFTCERQPCIQKDVPRGSVVEYGGTTRGGRT